MPRQHSCRHLEASSILAPDTRLDRIPLAYLQHLSNDRSSSKQDAGVDQIRAEQEIRDLVGKVPGIQSEVTTFLGDRISESLTGDTADISVKDFGSQLDKLDSVARQIVGVLTGMSGVADLQFKPESAAPTLSVQINPTALAASGSKTADVLEALQSNYTGVTLGQTYKGIRSVELSS